MLDLSWSKNCVIYPVSGGTPVAAAAALPKSGTGTTLQINGSKLYALLVTLSINKNITFLEHLKQAT